MLQFRTLARAIIDRPVILGRPEPVSFSEARAATLDRRADGESPRLKILMAPPVFRGQLRTRRELDEAGAGLSTDSAGSFTARYDFRQLIDVSPIRYPGKEIDVDRAGCKIVVSFS